jgi:hypothetical protein
MNPAAKAARLALMLSESMSTVAYGAFLVLIVVVQQFVRDRRTHYPLVLLATYFGVTRAFVFLHLMPSRAGWEPRVTTWAVWVLYYLAHGALVAASVWKTRGLWSGNAWGGRVLQGVTICFVAYHGLLTVFKPYRLLLAR